MIDFRDLDTAKCCDGLVPAIIQDSTTLQVLMLGYMNGEAYDKTVAEGRVTFYSRTKRRLWTKGETSGNFLIVRSITVDCDNDTLLIKAEPCGPVCHTGTKTCFAASAQESENTGFILHLEQVIKERHRLMPEGSYTTKLFEKGINKIAQKVGEEAVETVIDAVAGNMDGVIYEVSDLVYHLLVLLEASGLSIADIENELAKRHK